ncbi:hypothetical protein PPTG_01607 [Phytophthora nicotianae INRA-310]|uniref:PPIase cyclophilin-type domain-containing protein n=1 Tax=Phytophthora nicotianae (strain INRA-310) TaxID=761204 RepID=W2R863_PHYN3|nr:hypothetical protein PPTG_01607 [Phytophthora nicotianae INRA-310]ETN21426.1 hypothetical protein PPTG_01607 [Phytophthora nicotianae INRA-310]
MLKPILDFLSRGRDTSSLQNAPLFRTPTIAWCYISHTIGVSFQSRVKSGNALCKQVERVVCRKRIPLTSIHSRLMLNNFAPTSYSSSSTPLKQIKCIYIVFCIRSVQSHITMAPRGAGALDARKVILLGMGLIFVAYFVVVNVFFDLSAQSPHLTQQAGDTQEQTREFTDEMAHEGANTGKKAATPQSTRSWEPKPDRKYVWLDVAINDVYVGRVTAELYADIAPKTVENFRALTTGEKGPDYAFKGSVCHRILKDFIVQCGDFTTGTGTGGRSIYGGRFEDEPNGLRLKHSKRYILQMANSGPNTNGSQFCFMLNAAPHLNGKHVVFGEVVEGFEVVDKMEQAGVERDGIPLQHKVSFMDGGEILF